MPAKTETFADIYMLVEFRSNFKCNQLKPAVIDSFSDTKIITTFVIGGDSAMPGPNQSNQWEWLISSVK